jgi:hypothetical protein
MKSWKTPTPEMVEKAVANMPRLEQQRYFFERLQNPHWIGPLSSKGFFSNPPEGIKHEAEGTIEVQVWPASRYLSRMAAIAPTEVCEVLLNMPETHNPFVIRDFIEAALVMPTDTADRLSSKISKLISTRLLFAADKAGNLAVNLSRGGKSDGALSVLRSVLKVVPDPRPISDEMKRLHFTHDARSAIRDYEYSLILEQNTLDLSEHLGIGFLSLLCDLLEEAFRIESRNTDSGDVRIEDYSYIWQTNLANSDHGLESPKRLLASAVLKSAEKISSKGMPSLSQVLDSLKKRRYKIFERVALQVVANKPADNIDAVRTKLLDKSLFDDIGVRPEYYELCEKGFGLLSQPEQEQILTWIDKGLDREGLHKRGFSEDQADSLVDGWRLERLTPLQTHLPPEWQERYATLMEKLGNPKHAKYPVHRSGAFATGAKSPKAEEDLESMSVAEVIEYLKNWNPGEEDPFFFQRPSPEGLGAVLSAVISKKPAMFGDQALRFSETDPTYVRSALHGFESAVRTFKPFSWEQVLELCRWVVSRPAAIPGRGGGIHTKDPDWTWSRAAIVSLVEEGFKNKAIPFSLRNNIWSVLQTLSEVQEASNGDYDYRNDESQDRDHWTASINRVKPRAIRGVVMYIEWCRDNIGKDSFSFGSVPEAKAVLDRHLDPEIEYDLDVRVIYGELLPFLAHVDEKWVSSNVPQILPTRLEHRPLRDVAWVAYLAANPSYDRSFEILSDFYSSAISEIGTPRKVGRDHLLQDADKDLGQHLMQLYWRGRLSTEAGTALTRFFRQAGDSLRAHTIAFVGRSLNPAEVPPEILERLMILWDYRLRDAESSEHKREMAAFGWWFISGCFDDNWALEHLYKSLRLSNGNMEPKLNTLDRLSTLANTYTSVVISCTELIIRADHENVILWTHELTTILRLVLKCGDPGAIKTAENVIDLLGARGDHQYRSLLS